MNKFVLGVAALVLAASVGVAQDMPLFTFAKLGAKWEAKEYQFNTGTVPPSAALGEKARCHVVTKDGATMYVGFADRAAVWAYPVKQDGSPDMAAGAPYAPLRIVEGYDNSREAREKREAKPSTLAVTALLIDSAGRIYAATPHNIQVFDPTGRICGTLPLPAAGEVRGLAWIDKPSPALGVNLGGTVWSRAMK